MKIKTPGLALHIKKFINDHLIPDDYQDWIVYSKLSIDKTKHSISTIIKNNIKLKQPTVYIGFEPYLVGSHLDPSRNGFSIENARGSTGGLPLGMGYDNPQHKTKGDYIKQGFIICTCDFQNECEYIPFLAMHPRLNHDDPNHRLHVNLNRKFDLCYMNRTRCPRRESMFNKLVERMNKQKCHSLSDCHGRFPETKRVNHNLRSLDDCWYNDDLYRQYSDYNFVLAMENTSSPGYVTEKIYNALLAGCIPIYFGDKITKRIFNSECFIDISDFESFDACAEHVANMTRDQVTYMQQQPIFTESNIYIDPTSDHYNSIRLNIQTLANEYKH